MTVVRSVIRSIKNEINNYDEGERLVRELTSNESTPPSTQMLIKLKHMLSNQYQFPSIFNMLIKRLKDYDKIRHVEKALIVIEYLLKNGDKKFIRYCQMELKTITRLQRYRYILNFKDYGGLIRKRSKRIYELLKNTKKMNAARAKAQGYSMAFKKGTQYKHTKKQQKTRSKKPKKTKQGITTKNKKKRSKKANSSKKSKVKKEIEPHFEPFDAPVEDKTIFEEPEDLLTGDWWMKAEVNSNTGVADEDFGWYTAGGDGPDAGFGDDGGQFNFGDENEFEVVDDNNVNDEEYEEEEEENIEQLYSELTKIDNIMEERKKKINLQTRNKQGKTMAQMVNEHVTVPIPASFDAAFINDALNPANGNTNGSDFDPFGLNAGKNTNINGFGNAQMSNNVFNTSVSNAAPSALFGYQTKTQSNMYQYGNDPFAGLASNGQQNYYTVGMHNYTNVSRTAKEKTDPFSEFTIK